MLSDLPLFDDLLHAVEGAAADEEDLRGVDLNHGLAGILAAALGGHACHGALDELEQRLLHAFAEPGVERVLTALRATRLMAATLSELCDQDEQARSDLRERLEAGVARWRRAGAAAALSAFIDEEHLAERLLPVEGGEQRLTNYAHIIELLNEAGRKYATPAGLLSWFESARAQKGGETRNLRLASDANLVTVETIHSSKGLQYPIVYLPSAESMAVMRALCSAQKLSVMAPKIIPCI